MTIRTRLSLWYAGVLFASLLAMGAPSYYEFVLEPRQKVAHGRTVGNKPCPDDDAFQEVLGIMLGWGVPALLLGLFGGWWLTRKALRPVGALADAAAHINEGNLSAPLPRNGNGDELDRLAEALNSMNRRLDDAFRRIREFTLHASHELKTPLTVLRGEMETALLDEHLTDSQRERMASQVEEVQRLSRIVDGLTFLTKAGTGQIALARATVRIDELVHDALADAEILAAPHQVKVTLTECEETTILGDRDRLRQLLLNLTDNAIKYNHRGGNVTLALHRLGQTAELRVANTGPGLSADLQERVFEPFFRADPSRSQAVEGSGLGLSIAKWIVTAHGGAIRLDSKPGDLTTVTVTFPLAPTDRSA